MAIMMGNGRLKKKETVKRTLSWLGKNYPKSWKAPDGREIPITAAKSPKYYNADFVAGEAGYEMTVPTDLGTMTPNDTDYPFKDGGSYFVTWTETVVGNTIEIAPDSFPSTSIQKWALCPGLRNRLKI